MRCPEFFLQWCMRRHKLWSEMNQARHNVNKERCTVIDREFWFWSSDWETFLSVMSLPAKDEKCSVSNALWQIWCRKQKNEFCTAWTYDKNLKPSSSFKALYDGLYEASQMFCFTRQCNQNKTIEKPCMRRCKLWSQIDKARHNFNEECCF